MAHISESQYQQLIYIIISNSPNVHCGEKGWTRLDLVKDRNERKFLEKTGFYYPLRMKHCVVFELVHCFSRCVKKEAL